jgi:hypothetical protein
MERPPTPERAQKNLFMQNKANLPNAQILINCVLTMDYVNIRLRSRFKNKANQTQFKANFPNAQMNISSVLTKDYENIPLRRRWQNKANSNPIQSQFKANQTQFQTRCTFCEFFLFFTFLCPSYNLAMQKIDICEDGCSNGQVVDIESDDRWETKCKIQDMRTFP